MRGAAIRLVRLVAAQGRRQISDLSFRALPRFHCELSRNPATLPGWRGAMDHCVPGKCSDDRSESPRSAPESVAVLFV